MNYLYVFCVLFSLVSCKAKSSLNSAVVSHLEQTVCPENGVCAYQIIENKALNVKTDNLGSVYLEMTDSDNFVVKFEYKKNSSGKHQDSEYREEVFIELNKNKLDFETTNLKFKKLFFARWCYCKGQTGYYKINEGKLSVTTIDKNSYKLHFEFTIPEVPQIINEINYTFSLQ
ncbi:hypothetical protein [Algibacter pectinivorans]|uniref:Uncharacterized protein n=1 Tax=Algibacter pectinivorans TaxID=870482 RepID=A0A1I1NNP1_9FLAO|nr:hypothetical protein [Algibacter pectinivorans]SFC99046.1 hypothetical protein SAMN04487987_102439 [Algibacter pectinivorans]